MVRRIKTNLLCLSLGCLLLAATGVEARADLSSSQARKALTRMAGFDLPGSAVRVKSVSSNSSASANVSADIRAVFKFRADKDGQWSIDEIRTGQDSWEEIGLIAAALGAPIDQSGCKALDPPLKKAASDPSVKRSRCLIGNLLGIDLPSDAVRIQEVNISPIPLSTEPSATVVAWVRVEAQLIKDKSGWQVDQLRTGNRNWVKVQDAIAALNQGKQQRARDELALVAAALEKFHQERGAYVISDSHREAIDFLTPHYLARVIRVDPWNQPYKYQGDRDRFTLRSLGPDRKADTPDDILSQSR